MTMFPIDIDFSRIKEVLTYDPQAPMIFSSGIFLWLFTAFLVVYVLLQHKHTARILFVTLFSYYFYYKSSGTYFFLLALVTVCDFFLAQLMARAEGYWKRKGLVVLSLSVNLGLLAYFKYTNFILQTLRLPKVSVLPAPVGVSFLTFLLISYLADVYLILYFPVVELYDRRLSERYKTIDKSVGLCLLCVFLPAIGSRTYRSCPRFYSPNPETPLCVAGNVRTGNLPDFLRFV